MMSRVVVLFTVCRGFLDLDEIATCMKTPPTWPITSAVRINVCRQEWRILRNQFRHIVAVGWGFLFVQFLVSTRCALGRAGDMPIFSPWWYFSPASTLC